MVINSTKRLRMLICLKTFNLIFQKFLIEFRNSIRNSESVAHGAGRWLNTIWYLNQPLTLKFKLENESLAIQSRESRVIRGRIHLLNTPLTLQGCPFWGEGWVDMEQDSPFQELQMESSRVLVWNIIPVICQRSNLSYSAVRKWGKSPHFEAEFQHILKYGG